MNAIATHLPLPWAARESPLEVDVGCHRGTFLIAMAEMYPDRRFLGIERQAGRVARCLQKIERLGLGNAFAVQGDGLGLMRELELRADVVHVSFPDPWPKRRHHVRRLVGRKFLFDAWAVIERAGTLRLMTDDESYFRAMERAAEGCDGFERQVWEDDRLYPPTEFQKKFLEKPVYRLALRRCDSMSSA